MLPEGGGADLCADRRARRQRGGAFQFGCDLQGCSRRGSAPEATLLNRFCPLMRRSVIEEVGFLDEAALPMATVENDLCLRVRGGWLFARARRPCPCLSRRVGQLRKRSPRRAVEARDREPAGEASRCGHGGADLPDRTAEELRKVLHPQLVSARSSRQRGDQDGFPGDRLFPTALAVESQQVVPG